MTKQAENRLQSDVFVNLDISAKFGAVLFSISYHVFKNLMFDVISGMKVEHKKLGIKNILIIITLIFSTIP